MHALTKRLGSVFGAALVLAWIVTTLGLALTTGGDDLPLLKLTVNSWWALLWLMTGLAIVILALASAWAAPQQNPPPAFFDEGLADHLNEPIIICRARGRSRSADWRAAWHNEAARPFITAGGYGVARPPGEVVPLLDRVRASGQTALQVIPLGEGLRYAVQALPLGRRRYALILRQLQADTNTFYENFIRRIVHDMRNPLAAIIGHAANLRGAEPNEAGDTHKSAATIENEAQRLARLVDSMLFDARLAYVPLEIEALDLADVVEEVIYIHEEAAVRAGKNLAVEVPPDRLEIDGDRDLLVRAFSNLVDNGLKYSERGARMLIRLEALPGAARVLFEDDGAGIPPEYLPDRIFQPLVRAGRHQASGSGLGLSIVKKIIEMHHGTITVQSQVGQGTTMRVTLPRKDAQP